MDNLKWFKFSPVDWVMGKIQKVPEATQIRFIRLMCLYWNKECFLTYDDAEVEIDKEHLDLLISKRIIKNEGDTISISFLDEQMENVGELREKRREAAMRRWNKANQNDAKEMQVHANALQDYADKSRVEKRREEKNKEINNINNAAFAKNCLEHPQWCETVCMQNKIPLAELKTVVEDFEKHLSDSIERHTTETEEALRHHGQMIKEAEKAIQLLTDKNKAA